MSDLEFWKKEHKKYLEELKVILTFKYSSLVGTFVAMISGGYVKSLNLNFLILIALSIYLFYNWFNSKEIELKKALIEIEESIRRVK